MTVAFDDVASVGTTALAFFIAAGSRDETPQEWGVAHLLEHLVFKGAGDLDHRAIAREMDRLGADINAFTTRDYTCFYARVLDDEALNAYRLLSALVTDPWLKADDLAREQNVVLEEMRESQDDPDEVLDLLLTESLYPDPAFNHDILGTEDSLIAITPPDLRGFFARNYRPSNMVFAISGGARDAVLEAVQHDFRGSLGNSQLPRVRAVPDQRFARKRVAVDWEQLHIGLAVPAPGRYDPGYAAALMTAGILGGQNSSRLWQRLREEEGMVYGVSTQYGPDAEFGEMVTVLSLGPTRVRDALQALSDEVERLSAHGPDPVELERTRTALYTMLVMAQETPDTRVMRLGRCALDGKEPPRLTALREQMQQVDRNAVVEMARRWSVWERVAAAWAGPVDTTLDIIEQMQRRTGHA